MHNHAADTAVEEETSVFDLRTSSASSGEPLDVKCINVPPESSPHRIGLRVEPLPRPAEPEVAALFWRLRALRQREPSRGDASWTRRIQPRAGQLVGRGGQ